MLRRRELGNCWGWGDGQFGEELASWKVGELRSREAGMLGRCGPQGRRGRGGAWGRVRVRGESERERESEAESERESE